MKNCPECGKSVSVHLMFCGVCGARMDLPQKIRRTRILFFLTPFFLILIGLLLCFEFGVINPADSGLAFGGGFAMIYLIAAALFWVFARVLKFPVLPESYWHAGMFTVFQFIACVALAFNLEPFIIGEAPRDLGPVQFSQARLEILAMLFLPSWFVGILTVSARAKVMRFPDEIKNRMVRFLAAHSLIILPLVFFEGAWVMYTLQPAVLQTVVRARIWHDLDVPVKALHTLEEQLKQADNQAPLHFLKGVVIMENQPTDYSPADARLHLEKAVSLNPDVPVYLYRLSMAYDLERDSENAIIAASQAVKLLPKDSFLWQTLGDLQLKYKFLPDAVVSFRQALKINPDNPLLLNNLAYTLLDMDQNLPEALAMARLSVEALPGLVFSLDTLAWAYYKNRRYGEALEIMNAVFEGRSEVSPEVDFHYAMILHAVGSLKNPVEAFDKLLARPEVAADHSLFKQVYAARSALDAPPPAAMPNEKGEADNAK